MEFSVATKPKSQVVLTAVVDDGALATYEAATVQRLVRETKLPGFRPGKAPEARVREHLGPEGVRARVIDDALPSIYAAGVKEQQLQPVGPPSATITGLAPLTVAFTVDVYPAVELRKVEKIRLTRSAVTVEDAEVEDVLAQLQKRLRTFAPVERPAALGDSVEVSFSGELEGKADPRLTSGHHPLLLGSNAFIPGFEEGLVGRSAGDTLDLALTFPADYRAPDLRGKPVVFHVTVEQVEEVTTPQLDDAFAIRATGKPDATLAALTAEIRTDLQREKERAEDARLDDAFADALAERTVTELPETLVHDEVHAMVDELERRVGQRGLKLEHYLELRRTTREGLETSLRPEAEKRLKVRLALRRSAEDLKVVVPDAEVEAALATIEDPAIRSNERVRTQLAAQLLLEKTLTTLRTAATKP